MGTFSTPNTNFGGVITGSLTPNIHVDRRGRPFEQRAPDHHADALRSESGGDDGIGVLCTRVGCDSRADRGSVRPYAEGSAGIARLQPHVTGLSGLPGAFANAGLAFLQSHRTDRHGGRWRAVPCRQCHRRRGLRHHQVFSDSWMQALALGGMSDRMKCASESA